MIKLSELKGAKGANHPSKRLGQGIGSGTGKTSGKGHKGDKSRTGGGVRPGFEGGQMPLTRRTPKRGFNNKRFARLFQTVNLERLAGKFESGADIDAKALKAVRLIQDENAPVKILGTGELDKALNITANAFSQSAKAKIEAAGGKPVEVQ